VAAAVPRTDQGVAAPGAGGAGPERGPEGASPRCTRIVRMTEGGSGRGVIAARRSRNSQRLEHQLPRPVVSGCLQLERDAAVAPLPQALLREGRTQEISAQTLQPCGPAPLA